MVWGNPLQGRNFLFSSIVLVYKTGKTRKIDLKLCHVHRNKSLTKSRYGDDISNTKKEKRNNEEERHKTKHIKSKSAPIASQSTPLNQENMEDVSYQIRSQSEH